MPSRVAKPFLVLGAVAAVAAAASGCSGSSHQSAATKPTSSASARAHAGAGAMVPPEVVVVMSPAKASTALPRVKKLPGVFNAVYDRPTKSLHVYMNVGSTKAQESAALSEMKQLAA